MNEMMKLGLGIVASVGIAVVAGEAISENRSSRMAKKYDQIFMKAGISEDKFTKMRDSIIKEEPLYATPDARSKMRDLAWQNEVEKINVKKAYDAGKAFVRDSIANATKVAEHIK